jgi:N-glycosylase/DNA lyase
VKLSFLSAAKTANSGQVFRAYIKDRHIGDNPFNRENEIHFMSGAEYAVINDKGEISSTNDEYFAHYFDLTTDYDEINKSINLDEKIITAGNGIRILRGEFSEIVISFIISANNNIKRIRKTIERLCEKYGEELTFNKIKYYTFPALNRLSQITADEFAAIGCGYRSPYLVKTIALLKNTSFAELNKLNDKALYSELRKFCGVGDKVASCIMLFCFHRLNICPIDTWIKKALTSLPPAAQTILTNDGYAGIAQQYIFYFLQFLKKPL